MAFANANISDIVATTIESRTRQIADNVTNNNALLKKLEQRGKIKTFSGGSKILQELSFAENANGGWYSGYDLLPVGVADVISAAEFDIKQAAVPVIISGLEMLQNSGKEAFIDLLEGRLEVAESTMANIVAAGIYSDGTGAGGKEITGLDAAVPLDPTTGTYGGIDRATWNLWQAFVASLQNQQRFMDPGVGNLGFPTLKFMGTDVVLDGGIYFPSQASSGTGAPTGTAFFLNTNYLHYRPHKDRNMVPLSPNRRYATNQDAEVQIMAWAGNLTCSGGAFQGRYDINP